MGECGLSGEEPGPGADSGGIRLSRGCGQRGNSWRPSATIPLRLRTGSRRTDLFKAKGVPISFSKTEDQTDLGVVARKGS